MNTDTITYSLHSSNNSRIRCLENLCPSSAAAYKRGIARTISTVTPLPQEAYPHTYTLQQHDLHVQPSQKVEGETFVSSNTPSKPV